MMPDDLKLRPSAVGEAELESLLNDIRENIPDVICAAPAQFQQGSQSCCWFTLTSSGYSPFLAEWATAEDSYFQPINR